ncbi:hypothetical protein B0H17DRAFT_1328576 [Mycena rosella]|uniref:Uncharacterized protein n=1 Tax=Mycena rosella TaxID=1033263 RepID=A0AAD7DTN7_MYCRO|nr:hypothetical protein B0H17DRAFT_1328576 [Mycena rosella]
MARRRPASNTHPAHPSMPTDSPKQSKAQRQRAPEQQPHLGMSPEARYNHNLKVLRRRDPSIISIFDQFSHVCVYHHNGAAWEKNGFEGSMFLYERDSYPPYGFYILNRMGMDDYIQRLYPEDVTGIHGTYLMLRSYPEFTNRRLGHVLSAHDEPPDKFADAYAIPDLDKLLDGDKGRAHTVGLWMFPTDAREPMIDVMMRLHSYIKRNVPYPEQFRYGPNRPPPPNPHLRTTSPSPPPEHHAAPSGDHGLDRSFPSGSATELDKLFARLTATPAYEPLPPTAPAPAPARAKSRSATMTVASLFAALGGAEVPAGETQDAPSPAPTPARGSGIPLLDSIFASAEPPPPAPPPAPAVPIHAPTPQILNHEVITSLLGLPPARAASAAASSSSREGDNEYEGGARAGRGSDGFSDSSTVLDPEAELDEELQAAGASAGRPLLSVPASRSAPANLNGAAGPKTNGKGRALGDATPRVNGHSTPARASQSQSQAQAQQSPFSAWTPVDDLEDAYADGDGEIVELDFAETRALSDPDALRAVLLQRGQAQARRGAIPSSNPHPHAPAHPHALPEGESSEGGGGARERKGRRKKRAAGAAGEGLHAQTQALAEPRERSGRAAVVAVGVGEPAAGGLASRAAGAGAAAAAAGGGSNESTSALEAGRVRAALVAAVSARPQPRALERNEFVREVLTLIHTDKGFVDALWRDYLAGLE